MAMEDDPFKQAMEAAKHAGVTPDAASTTAGAPRPADAAGAVNTPPRADDPAAVPDASLQTRIDEISKKTLKNKQMWDDIQASPKKSLDQIKEQKRITAESTQLVAEREVLKARLALLNAHETTPTPTAEPAKERKGAAEHGVEAAGDTIDGGKIPNEDSITVDDEHGLYAVYDGVSTPAGAEEASAFVKKYIEDHVLELEGFATAEEASEKLTQLVKDASVELSKYLSTNYAGTDKVNLSTTASIVKIWHGPNGERKAIISNVGDSRVYKKLLNGKLVSVTLDDNLILRDQGPAIAREMQDFFANLTLNLGPLNDHITGGTQLNDVEKQRYRDALKPLMKDKDIFDPANKVEVENANTYFDLRNYIINAVGGAGASSTKPRPTIVTLQEGEQLVITCDGVHDNLTDTEILTVLNENGGPVGNTRNLLMQSMKRGTIETTHPRSKRDNISAIIINIKKVEQLDAAKTPPTESALELKANALEQKMLVFSQELAEVKKQNTETNTKLAAATTKLDDFNNLIAKVQARRAELARSAAPPPAPPIPTPDIPPVVDTTPPELLALPPETRWMATVKMNNPSERIRIREAVAARLNVDPSKIDVVKSSFKETNGVAILQQVRVDGIDLEIENDSIRRKNTTQLQPFTAEGLKQLTMDLENETMAIDHTHLLLSHLYFPGNEPINYTVEHGEDPEKNPILLVTVTFNSGDTVTIYPENKKIVGYTSKKTSIHEQCNPPLDLTATKLRGVLEKK